MPIADYTTETTKDLKGLHLFHYTHSNCSQRVRMALAEKDLDWTSHYIDLIKGEHLEEGYKRINPKAVVPSLVDDGQIITDSMDIIAYLDEKYPDPPLLRMENIDSDKVTKHLQAAENIQRTVKTLTFELQFKKRGAFPKEKAEAYIKRQTKEGAKFMEEFIKGFSQERMDRAMRDAMDYCSEIDKDAGQSEFLAGAHISLADIAEIVNVERLYVLKLELDQFKHMRRWYDMINSRPSYQKSLFLQQS